MAKITKKESINQVWLSFVFMIVIMGNFITVAGIDYYYETNGFGERQSLFITDSSTDFTVTEFGDDYGTPFYDSQRTGQYTVWNNYHQWNRTPAYLGNNTWSIACNDTTGLGGTVYTGINIWFALPNADTWLIDNVLINITLPGETDQRLAIALWGYNEPILNSGANNARTLIYNQDLTLGLSSLSYNVDVSLLDALNFYDNTNQYDNYDMNIYITDSGNNGISGFACAFSVDVIGEIVSGWSVESSLLVSVTVWNVIIGLAIIYSLDMFDLGGFVKTIRKQRR